MRTSILVPMVSQPWIPACAGMTGHGACRGAKPLCVAYSSPKIGGHRGLNTGTSQIRLDLRYLTHRWQKAIEDVLTRLGNQMNSTTVS